RVLVHVVPSDPLPVAPGAPMVDRILRWAVAAAVHVETLAVDVVESHNWESESIGVLRAGRTPVVVRIATPHLVVAREAGWVPSPDLADAIALERWLTAEADGVSHSTDAIRATIERELAVAIGDDRRALIPFGMAVPPDAPAAGGSRLLFVGRLEAR